jgi:hypothetical protein
LHLNVGDFIKRLGAARGIDMKGLIPTDAQIAQATAAGELKQAMISEARPERRPRSSAQRMREASRTSRRAASSTSVTLI